MTRFKGKALYKPEGRAGEYARWACNLFNGCSNDCNYCYCKKGVLSHAMGGSTPTLKKCFKDEEDAFNTFKKELDKNYGDVRREGGVFFSFSTDPCLPETFPLTLRCMDYAFAHKVPVTILTKCVDWTKDTDVQEFMKENKDLLCVGFTLTGCDEEEPGAPRNGVRCIAMRVIHCLGVKTFASIEPIVNLGKSLEMIERTCSFCDLYKIGLMSGVKKDYYGENQVEAFIMLALGRMQNYPCKVYWKESIRERVAKSGMTEYLKNERSVEYDYNIFES